MKSKEALFAAGPVLAKCGRFQIKIAESEEEIRHAQELRYQVFKQEQKRMAGLTEMIDQDRFDRSCLHLLVIDGGERVVGTYRMQSGKTARECDGFYSETEYELPEIDAFLDDVFEVGRSCVDPEFRRGAVVALLWAGIVEIRRRCDFHYMLGCVSLLDIDSRIGWGVYAYLKRNGYLSGEIARPRPEFKLPEYDGALLDDAATEALLPPLFKGYLRINAKICGQPVWDRDFGSIDFPVWFDFRSLPEKYVRHFHVQES